MMTNPSTNDLSIDAPVVRQALVSFIRTELSRTGFKHAVIGLSGGIDSSLACFLAAEALGPENVLAIRMPSKGSIPAFPVGKDARRSILTRFLSPDAPHAAFHRARMIALR